MAKYLTVEYFYPFLNTLYAEAFAYLESIDQPYIPILICSYGGYTDCLSTLLDCIQNSSKPVMTIATGVDMSCGCDLFVSGTKGLRIIGNNTTSLIHQVGSMAWGKTSDIEHEANEVVRLNNKLLYNLFDKAGDHEDGYTKNLIKEHFNADLYLTSEEMIQHGWADKVMSASQAILNMDNIFADYKAMKEKAELNEILDPCVPVIEPVQE